MSVGRTTGRPSPIAATASSTRRSSVDHSLTSREIFPDRDLLVAEPCAAARRRPAPSRRATSNANEPPGTRRLSAPRRSPRSRRTRPAPRAARARRPLVERIDLVRRHVRRVRDDEVERPVEPREQLALDELDAAGRSPRRSRAATASASGRRVRSGHAAPGCSSAIASAIAPDPVPMSSTVGSARSASSSRQRSTSDLRLGPRDQDARIDPQREPAESPLAEHVRERLARSPGARRAPGRGAPSRPAPRRRPCTAASRDTPSACASSHSASTRGDGTPARSSSPVASTRRSRTVTLRARGGGLRPPVPR